LNDKPSVWSFSILGSISLLVFALAAWFAWKKLVQNEYRKIKEQAEVLASHESEERV